jgi:hypothetical protein
LAFIFGIAFAVSAAASLWLAWLLRRERAARRAAEAAVAAERQAAESTTRHDLLDLRRAAIAPIESLWLAWAGGGLPDDDLLAEAARALAEARLLFAADLAGELDEAAALILEQVRGRRWQRAAIDAGRHDERTDLIGEEMARERQLKPRIASLRLRLFEAARLA